MDIISNNHNAHYNKQQRTHYQQNQMPRHQQQQQQLLKYKKDYKVTQKTSNLGNAGHIFNNLSKVFRQPSSKNTTKKLRGHHEKITNGLYTVERVNHFFSINFN